MLKPIESEYLKAGNVKDTNVGDLFHGGVAQRFVTFFHHDPKSPLVDCAGNTGHGVGSIGAGRTLLHPEGGQTCST